MFTVTADIRYVDGTLADLTISGGYRTNYPDMESAMRAASWITSAFALNDQIKATGTGNRYVFASPPAVTVQ